MGEQTNHDQTSTGIASSIQHLGDALRDRISSPFISSFLIAAIVNNYKFFVVLLSDERYESKFRYIGESLYKNQTEYIQHWLLVPSAAAIIYTFVWPAIDQITVALRRIIFNVTDWINLKAQHRQPIDSHRQKEFFDKWTKENKRLQEIISENDSVFQESIQRLDSVLSRSKETIKRHMRRCLAAELKTDEQTILLLSESRVLTTEISPLTASEPSSETPLCMLIANFLIYQRRDTSAGTTTITEATLNKVSPVDENFSAQDFMLLLWSVGLLNSFDYDGLTAKFVGNRNPVAVSWWTILKVDALILQQDGF